MKSTAYKQVVRPVLEYASASWDSASDAATSHLEAVQRRAARLTCDIRRTNRAASTTGLLQRLNLQPLSECRGQRRLAVFSQYHHTNTTTPHCSGIYGPPNIPPVVDIQTSTLFHSLTLATTKDPFFIRTTREWNGITADSWLLRPLNI